MIVERGLSGKGVRKRPTIVAVEPFEIDEEYAEADWAVPREVFFRCATRKVISGKILGGSGLHFSEEDLDMFLPKIRFGGPKADEPCENEAAKEENEDQSEPTTPVHKKHMRAEACPHRSSSEFFGQLPEFWKDTSTSVCGDVQYSWGVTPPRARSPELP